MPGSAMLSSLRWPELRPCPAHCITKETVPNCLWKFWASLKGIKQTRCLGNMVTALCASWWKSMFIWPGIPFFFISPDPLLLRLSPSAAFLCLALCPLICCAFVIMSLELISGVNLHLLGYLVLLWTCRHTRANSLPLSWAVSVLGANS